MPYDTDKTSAIFEALKAAMRAGNLAAAMRLLRQADSSGCLRRDSGTFEALRKATGGAGAERLLQSFACDPCLNCTSGRERCADCEGKGIGRRLEVCETCAGLGMERCPFCNGTALAGYDFVPRGLRPRVIGMRMRFAQRQIASLSRAAHLASTSTREIAERIVALDRCRGICANAVEQSRILEQQPARATTKRGGLVSGAERVRVEREGRSLNGKAEAAIRALYGLLAQRYAQKARSAGEGAARKLALRRAETFNEFSRGDRLDGSALRTPMALRRAP